MNEISFSEARKYLSDRYGLAISRQRFWNWTRQGIAGNAIAVFQKPAIGRFPFQWRTTVAAIDEFIACVSPQSL